MKRLKRRAADLKRILLTHGHRSHLGGLAALKDLTGAEVLCHAAEKVWCGWNDVEHCPKRFDVDEKGVRSMVKYMV